MEKNIEMSLLFDFYGELLKPQCRKAVDLCCNSDFSLAEAAEEMGITRQGVRDNLRRGEQQLYEYEEKLGLFGQFTRLEKGLEKISALANKIKAETDDENAACLARQIADAAGDMM